MKPYSPISLCSSKITAHNLQTALQERIVIKIGVIKEQNLPIVITTNLFRKNKKSYLQLIENGLRLLLQANSIDNKFYKFRVVEESKVCVILYSEGIIFFEPNDF